MVSLKGIHRAFGDQVAAQGRRIQQLDTSGVSCPCMRAVSRTATGNVGPFTSDLLSSLLGPAQVGRDQQHVLAGLGQDDGQVGRGGALALPRPRPPSLR